MTGTVESRIVTDQRLGDLHYPVGDQVMAPQIERTGRWEPEQGRWLDQVVKPGHTVLVVGANVGYFALWAAGLVGPAGQVVAIEPDPTNFALLRRNVMARPQLQVHCEQVAASDETGTLHLYLDPDNPGDHRTYARADRSDLPSLQVPAIQLDDLLGDRQVDVVLTDCQGFDHRALRGLRRTLARDRPPILTELVPTFLAEQGESAQDVLAELTGQDYHVGFLEYGLPAGARDPGAVLDRMAATGRLFVTAELWPRGRPLDLRVSPDDGFWPSEMTPAGERSWLVASEGALWLSGPAGAEVQMRAGLVPPPCGPQEVFLGGERLIVSEPLDWEHDVMLDERGLGRVDISAAEVCRVPGDPRALRVAVVGPTVTQSRPTT